MSKIISQKSVKTLILAVLMAIFSVCVALSITPRNAYAATESFTVNGTSYSQDRGSYVVGFYGSTTAGSISVTLNVTWSNGSSTSTSGNANYNVGCVSGWLPSSPSFSLSSPADSAYPVSVSFSATIPGTRGLRWMVDVKGTGGLGSTATNTVIGEDYKYQAFTKTTVNKSANVTDNRYLNTVKNYPESTSTSLAKGQTYQCKILAFDQYGVSPAGVSYSMNTATGASFNSSNKIATVNGTNVPAKGTSVVLNASFNGSTKSSTFSVSHVHTYDNANVSPAHLKEVATCTHPDIYFMSCDCGASGTTTFTNGEALPHDCSLEVANENYLVSSATCTSVAVYNKSCVCGLKGEDTFTYGSMLPHSYVPVVKDEFKISDATCTEYAVYHKSCSVCGTEGTEEFTAGDLLPHVYIENPTEQYLNTSATCTASAIYNKSCQGCGVVGNETFVYGNPLPHDCSLKVVHEDYIKEQATCTSVAVYYKSCVCGLKGDDTFTNGTTLPHNHIEFINDDYKVSDATCTEYAVYYKSCEDCGIESSETFTAGELLAHDYVEKVAEEYLVSNATCTALAVYNKSCSQCGTKGSETFTAGELLAHDCSLEVEDELYIKEQATCTSVAVYYKSCVCGLKGDATFNGTTMLDHVYNKEEVAPQYLKAEATLESAAEYYHSCKCGEKGETTFTYGAPLTDDSTVEVDTSVLKLDFASISLNNNFQVNFKVNKEKISGFSNIKLTVSMASRYEVITEYVEAGDNYVFIFSNVLPSQMGENITAILSGEVESIEYSGVEGYFTVSNYCYIMLNNSAYNQDSELCTLLVDLLNYGAEAQKKVGVEAGLVNEALTEEQKVLASGEPVIESVENVNYEDENYSSVENASVTWVSAGLNILTDGVAVRIKISTENIEGVYIIVKNTAGEVIQTITEFVETDGGYYAYVVLSASQVRKVFFATVFVEEQAVSNTLRYSVESYAYTMQNTEYGDLVKALIKYGDSARAYNAKV